MPFVDLLSSDDYVTLWYCTNTINNRVGLFDPAKPTIVFLHPWGLDSSWMMPQFEDPRLRHNYNLVAFDTRISGRSFGRFSPKHDLWVTAADLAQAFYHLQLSPAHIFAPDLYCFVAIRFAALFPQLCLSLALCNVPPPTEIKTTFETLEEIHQIWAYADDLETVEYANRELLNFYGGEHASIDLQDEIVAYWQTSYAPFRRAYLIANLNLTLNRVPLTQAEYRSIRTPVLIIQADQCTTHPFSQAEQLSKKMVNVPGGARVYPLKSTAGYLSLVDSSIVNKVFSMFLKQQPPATSQSRPLARSLEDLMRPALERLARLKNDDTILNRDAKSPISFSCISVEVQKNQEETIASCSKGQREAYSPLDRMGRPLRKFSQRNAHWLDGGMDGYSYADWKQEAEGENKSNDKTKDTSSALIRRPKQTPTPEGTTKSYERPNNNQTQPDHNRTPNGNNTSSLVDNSEQSISLEIQDSPRNRRTAVLNPSVDKQVIKGSMAKVVVSSAAGMPRIFG